MTLRDTMQFARLVQAMRQEARRQGLDASSILDTDPEAPPRIGTLAQEDEAIALVLAVPHHLRRGMGQLAHALARRIVQGEVRR